MEPDAETVGSHLRKQLRTLKSGFAWGGSLSSIVNCLMPDWITG